MTAEDRDCRLRQLLVGVGAERVHEGQVQSRRSGSRVPDQAAAAAANLQATNSAQRLMTWASAAVSRSRSLKRKASTVRMVFAIHLTQWSTLRRRNGCRAWNNSTESNYAELQKFSVVFPELGIVQRWKRWKLTSSSSHSGTSSTANATGVILSMKHELPSAFEPLKQPDVEAARDSRAGGEGLL